MRVIFAGAATILLCACMTPSEEGPQGIAQNPNGGECEASTAQSLIGRTADIALGEEVLAATNARVLRWIPPDSAVTMDYRTDRVSVAYDRGNNVTSIRCG